MRRHLHLLGYLAAIVFLLHSCAKMSNAEKRAAQTENTSGSDFTGYSIADSTAIVTYADGLKIYKVLEGPGQFPRDGMNIRLNYHGTLTDGETFDSTYWRDEPFEFKLGQTPVIAGLSEAVKKMRFGSKAVVIVPSSLGYGNREDRPANIPSNSSLIFHIEMLGSF